MPKITLDDNVELFYNVSGNGTPVVLISGGFSDHHVWDEVLENIASDYQVITYDQRGSGNSGFSDSEYSVQRLSMDLYQLFQHLDIDHAHLVGHSMGGFVAQHFAAHHHEKVLSLSLLSSILAMNEVGREFLDQVINDAKHIPQQLKSRLFAIAGVDQTIQQILKQAELCRNYDARPYIHRIIAPALVLSGSQEPIMHPGETEILASSIKNFIRLSILDCGHMLPIEAPDIIASEIKSFIALSGK